jgi:hypothetical protein
MRRRSKKLFVDRRDFLRNAAIAGAATLVAAGKAAPASPIAPRPPRAMPPAPLAGADPPPEIDVLTEGRAGSDFMVDSPEPVILRQRRICFCEAKTTRFGKFFSVSHGYCEAMGTSAAPAGLHLPSSLTNIRSTRHWEVKASLPLASTVLKRVRSVARAKFPYTAISLKSCG